MPRTRGLTNSQKIEYRQKVMADQLELLLHQKKITKQQVADYIGISRQAIVNQFSKKVISVPVLMAIVTLTDADPKELKDMVYIEGR